MTCNLVILQSQPWRQCWFERNKHWHWQINIENHSNTLNRKYTTGLLQYFQWTLWLNYFNILNLFLQFGCFNEVFLTNLAVREVNSLFTYGSLSSILLIYVKWNWHSYFLIWNSNLLFICVKRWRRFLAWHIQKPNLISRLAT